MTNKKFTKVYKVLQALDNHFREAENANVQAVLYGDAQLTEGDTPIKAEIAEAFAAMHSPNRD